MSFGMNYNCIRHVWLILKVHGFMRRKTCMGEYNYCWRNIWHLASITVPSLTSKRRKLKYMHTTTTTTVTLTLTLYKLQKMMSQWLHIKGLFSIFLITTLVHDIWGSWGLVIEESEGKLVRSVNGEDDLICKIGCISWINWVISLYSYTSANSACI